MSLVEISGNDKNCLCCCSASTPLWRLGPDGSKSLCNACGVRWRRTSKDKPKKKLLDSPQLLGIVRVCSPDEVELVARTPEDMSPDPNSSPEEIERCAWDEISEVAAELTRLSEAPESRKRKRSSSRSSSKRHRHHDSIALEMISEKLDFIRQQQEANDRELDTLHASLLRQNNERVAVTTMAAELHRQVEILQQAVAERDRMIEELKHSFRAKALLQKVKTGSWEL